MRSAIVSVLFVGSLALPACGGRAGIGGGASECPPGEICTPAGCAAGGVCPLPGWGATDAGALVPDEGGPFSPVGPSSPVYPDGSVPPTSSSLNVLGYQVIDAKFSAALSSLVIVSAAPTNALHVYNTTTKSDHVVALPAAPVAVAIDSTGLHAAVAYDAHVSWVDLASSTLTASCAISSDAYDIALSKNGVAYVMPRTDQWVSLHVIDPSCKDVLLKGSQVYAGSRIALQSETALFTADRGLSPSSINRCDLKSSPVQCNDALTGLDWGKYAFCGELWISVDGQRIYTGCGVTLRVSSDGAAAACTYGGTLAGVTFIQHMSEAPQATRIALIPGDRGFSDPGVTAPPIDTVVRVYETNFLGFVTQLELPLFPVSGRATAVSHGRFVFSTPTMDRLFVIVQADASSGALNDFAVVTMAP